MKTILVPLDGSTLADRAVPFAATIATRSGSALLLLRAVDTLRIPTESAELALKREAQEALDSVAAALVANGLNAATRVVDGQAETAILAATADDDVSLVVMSTHGRSGLGRFIYGSVADTVLRHAPVPVLTVPPHGLDAWSPDQPVKILVPLDGSEVSTAALAPACELADLLGGSLLLASIVTFPSYAPHAEGHVFIEPDPNDSLLIQSRDYLEAIATKLRTDARPVEVSATYGSPYFGIMTVARDLGAGLIAMATHGRGGVARALLGSVATATIRQTDIPIALVRPVELQAMTGGQRERPLDDETYRQIVDGASDAIVVADASGTITYWNAGAEALFGFVSAEAVGQSLDLIVPEPQRARHWDGYRRVMETGTTRYDQALLAVPALHRDGRRLSIEFKVILLRASDGTPSGSAAIVRDVTGRWNEDRALRRRLRELEEEEAHR